MGKHKVLILLLILSVLALSGCADNDYPKVTIDTALKSNFICIDIGQPYVYKVFDIESTDKGKDLILHFTEGE